MNMKKSVRWVQVVFVAGAVVTGVSLYPGCGSSNPPGGGGGGGGTVGHGGNGNMSIGRNGLVATVDVSKPCKSRADCIWPSVCAYAVVPTCPTFDTNFCAPGILNPISAQCVLMANPSVKSFCACPADNDMSHAKPFSVVSDGNYTPVIATADTSLCLPAGQTAPDLLNADLDNHGDVSTGATVCSK
jgi:hypothetical protein